MADTPASLMSCCKVQDKQSQLQSTLYLAASYQSPKKLVSFGAREGAKINKRGRGAGPSRARRPLGEKTRTASQDNSTY